MEVKLRKKMLTIGNKHDLLFTVEGCKISH